MESQEKNLIKIYNKSFNQRINYRLIKENKGVRKTDLRKFNNWIGKENQFKNIKIYYRSSR